MKAREKVMKAIETAKFGPEMMTIELELILDIRILLQKLYKEVKQLSKAEDTKECGESKGDTKGVDKGEIGRVNLDGMRKDLGDAKRPMEGREESEGSVGEAGSEVSRERLDRVLDYLIKSIGENTRLREENKRLKERKRELLGKGEEAIMIDELLKSSAPPATKGDDQMRTMSATDLVIRTYAFEAKVKEMMEAGKDLPLCIIEGVTAKVIVGKQERIIDKLISAQLKSLQKSGLVPPGMQWKEFLDWAGKAKKRDE